MQDQLLPHLIEISDWVRGPRHLILLVGTGIYLTLRLQGLQFRSLWHSLYLALIKCAKSEYFVPTLDFA